MPRSVVANVNPGLLSWAREDAGHSIETASEKTGYAVERLRAWEAGDAKPTIAQLRELAARYRRPLSIFFMPSPPPRGFEPLRDFRRMPDADDARWSPELRALVRRARMQQRVYVDLLRDLGEDVPLLPTAPAADDPEAVGAFARNLLAVGIDEQRSWSNESDALRGWTRAVEAQGVLTVYTATTRGHGVPVDEMLGFSDPEPAPIIVLNGADNVRRRTFTLLHEFAHLLLRRAGVCDLHDSYTTHNYDPTEVFCNAVAAAVLMPRHSFLGDPDVSRSAAGSEWRDQELGAIARRFTTSREAVLRRLLTLGLTTEGFYRAWRAAYYEAWEEEQAQSSPASGGPSYSLMKVRELGVPYISTVLDAHNRRLINSSDLARFLNINLKSLPGVEREFVKAISRSG
jgi:Zn-dependent peptidase ImmA (M78 family)/transcriptional regulator with XRE-family HTH domain